MFDTAYLAGVANGTPMVMHSVSFACGKPPRGTSAAAHLELHNAYLATLQEQIDAAQPGEVIWLRAPPTSVNLSLPTDRSHHYVFTREESLSATETVLPVPLDTSDKVEAVVHGRRRKFNSTVHGVAIGFAVTFHKVST